MIDDDDDHIRRNIVVVSSSILLAAWLELPASSLFDAILPDSLSLEPRKLWAVGFAILSYLGVRYKFSADGQAFTNAFQGQLHVDRQRGLEKLLRKDCRIYEASGKSPRSGGELEKAIQITRESERHNATDARPALYVKEHAWRSLTCAECAVLLTFTKKQGGRSSEAVDVTYQWPLHVVVFTYLRVWVNALFYSDVGIKKVSPLLLALCAEAVLLLRLTHLYLSA